MQVCIQQKLSDVETMPSFNLTKYLTILSVNYGTFICYI